MAASGLSSWNRKQQYTPANVQEVHYRDRWDLPELPKSTVVTQSEEQDDTPLPQTKKRPWWMKLLIASLRFLFLIGFIGLILAIPLLITSKYAFDDSNDNTAQLRNFLFWFFFWLEITLLIASVNYLVGVAFPYLFYAVASWVNPAHRRYWRIFRPLAPRFMMIFSIMLAWATFRPLVAESDFVSYLNKDPEDTEALDSIVYVVDNTLMNAIFWAVGYIFVKLLITYISIHYHYRSGHGRIEQSKAMIHALVMLYKASLSLDPLYCDKFQEQDILIRHTSSNSSGKRQRKVNFFQKMGGASRSVLSAFGTMLGSEGDSHWLQPGSTHTIVEHALEHPAAAEALAQRIWKSLVPASSAALTKKHIAEVLPLDRKDQAESCFKALDENENGDIRLKEFEMTVVEMGKTRANIYQNLHDIDHAINTFDWIMLFYLALFMMFIILIGYVDFLKQLKDIFGFVGLGLSFALGRVVADFLNGCVFIFFKHPYDVGDRIDLYNIGEGLAVGCVVKRISLLYCVFQRTDTNATVQFSNARLWDKRIENATRSVCADEKFTMILDIDTSFKDLEYLRDELKAFIARPENSRDYKPGVALRVKSIHELNKMEIAMVVSHKNNWSMDGLKSARSSRIYCALIEIARRIPLSRPMAPATLVGDAIRPNYTVVLSHEEAADRKSANELKLRQKRFDFDDASQETKKEPQDEATKAIESAAYENISSIPATMAGRKADRPAAQPQPGSQPYGTSTGAAYVFGDDFGSRQRRPVPF